MKGVNDRPGTPNYDMYQKALRSTAQRLYPNYVNVDWSAQTCWRQKDRIDKQNFIDSLDETTTEKLIYLLEQYPEYKDIFGIDIIDE